MTPHSSNRTTEPRYQGLSISLTPRGRAVPIIYGTNKVTSDIIWASDFQIVSYKQSSGSSGGKGGGSSGGKGGGGSTSYYYFAAFMGAICEGPIYAIVAARNGSTWVYFCGDNTPQAFPIVSTGSNQVINAGQEAYEAYPLLEQIGGDGGTMYNVGLPLPYQQYLRTMYAWYEGQGMVDQQGFINPTNNQGYMYNGQHFQMVPGTEVWESQSLSMTLGWDIQGPPPWMTQMYPQAAIPYKHLAYWWCQSYQLGQSATPPTLDFWIMGLLCYDPTAALSGEPIIDASPRDVVVDMFTNQSHGLMFPTSMLDTAGTLAAWHNYCVAAGLFVSVVIQGQTKATDTLQQLCDQTVSESWVSEGVLKIKAYWDQTITGNGKTYAPDVTLIYTLTPDHFITKSSTDDPITATRKGGNDTYNQLSIQFSNRLLNYSTDTLTVDDQALQQISGRIMQGPPTSGTFIADPTVAYVSARIKIQHDAYCRETYSFKLPLIFCLLEPMDIVELNDQSIGLINFPARIQSINLGTDGEYSVTALEIGDEVHSLGYYSQIVINQTGLAISAPPGPTSPPIIFTAPTRLATHPLEVWIAISGTRATWGGCDVWVSLDNQHYAKMGQVIGASRYGYMTADLATFPTPGGNDTTDDIMIALSTPRTELGSLGHALAAKGATVAAILDESTEIVSYGTADYLGLGGNGLADYELSDLFRGLSGTAPAQHFKGSPFVILDDSLAKIPFDISMLDQTIYLKFTSFNQIGSADQSLSNVTAYTYTIGFGISSPYGPSNFVVGVNDTLTIFSWQLDQSPEVDGYEIRFGTVGSTWDTATMLIKGTSSSHNVSAAAPVGQWAFFLASYDKHGKYSLFKPEVTFTVPTFFIIHEHNFGAIDHAIDPFDLADVIILDESWGRGSSTAVFTNCFAHPTKYFLVPDDQAMANYSGSLGGWEVFDEFLISPFSTYNWVGPVIDSTQNGTQQRLTAAPYTYLYSLPEINTGSDTISYGLATLDWSNFTDGLGTINTVTISGGLIHPTTYTIVPDSTVMANYVPTGGTGFEVFDFGYMPPNNTVVTLVAELSGVFPVAAVFNSAIQAGANGTGAPPQATLSISWSTDGITYSTPVTQSGGSVSASFVAQWVKLTASLNNTVLPVCYTQNVTGQLSLGPGSSYVPIVPQLATSIDNVTWGPWQPVFAISTTDEFVQAQLSWTPQDYAWPEGPASLFLLLDAPTSIQGANGVAVPITGLTVTFNPPYRTNQISIVCTAVGSASTVPIVTAQSPTQFTVQCFNSSGTPVAATINWSAAGV